MPRRVARRPPPADHQRYARPPEAAAARAVDEEVDGGIERDECVTHERHVATRHVEVPHRREAGVQRPQQVSDERRQIARDADADQCDDDDRRTGGGVTWPAAPRRQRARLLVRDGLEASDLAELTTEARGQPDEDRHGEEVHAGWEEDDTVANDVVPTAEERGRLHAHVAERVFEAARQGEDGGEEKDEGDVTVDDGEAGDGADTPRPTNGHVAVHAQQHRHPGVGEPREVHARVEVGADGDEEAHAGRRPQGVRSENRQRVLQQHQQQHDRVDDGERL